MINSIKLRVYLAGVILFILIFSSISYNFISYNRSTFIALTLQSKVFDKSTCNVESMTGNSSGAGEKIIFNLNSDGWLSEQIILLFDNCEYSNCVYQHCNDLRYVDKADLVLVYFGSKFLPSVERQLNKRQRQLWFVYGHESPGYAYNHWSKTFNRFDGTMTYSLKSTVYYPYFQYVPLLKTNHTKPINYAKGKTKGAFAYVSNCDSTNYNRLSVMRQLSKYIDIDIFGQCTGSKPCPLGDTACEAAVHSPYRFYLAFENSLCEDYITEKYWKTLSSTGNFLPVAVGGLSLDDYNIVSPPNSFVHLYNFTSVENLGKYLRYLMANDEAYNKFHAWKDKYTIANPTNVGCELCKIANNQNVKAQGGRPFADEWNDSENCRSLGIS